MTSGISATDKKWILLAGCGVLALWLFWPRKASAAGSGTGSGGGWFDALFGAAGSGTRTAADKQAATTPTAPTVPQTQGSRLPGYNPTPFGSAGYNAELGSAGYQEGLLSSGSGADTGLFQGTDEEAEMAAKDFGG